MQHDDLVARTVAAHQFHPVGRTVQVFREQPHEGLVRRGIDRRRGHFDAQLVAERFADAVSRGARLQFHREQHASRMRAKKSRLVHQLGGFAVGRAMFSRAAAKPGLS